MISTKKLEKLTDVIIWITAILAIVIYYPKLASFFIGSGSMNVYQIIWNICLCFFLFNVYLLLLVFVFRLKKKLDRWLTKD